MTDTRLHAELRRMCVEQGSAGRVDLPVVVVEQLLRDLQAGEDARERESRWVAHLQRMELADEEGHG